MGTTVSKIRGRRKGKIGETIACHYLAHRGHKILEINYHARRGEVDIISVRAGRMSFIEVKYWPCSALAGLEFSVSKRKQLRIVNTAMVFLSNRPRWQNTAMSFDVLFVDSGSWECKYYPSAFGVNG